MAPSLPETALSTVEFSASLPAMRMLAEQSGARMTGANSVASFQKRHSRRSFDNCGSAPTSRDLSNRKVPQEWRGGHACAAELAAPGGAISFAICLHGDLSTRGPHLGLGPSVDGLFYIYI